MFSCAQINRGSRDRKLGEETRDVGENTVLGEEQGWHGFIHLDFIHPVLSG